MSSVNNISMLFSSFWDNSIIGVIQDSKFDEKVQESQELSYIDAIKNSVKNATIDLAKRAIVFYSLIPITRLIFSNENKQKCLIVGCSLKVGTIIAPIVEEFVFRFCVQGSIQYIQSLAQKTVLNSIKDSSVLKVGCSSKTRILITGFLFGFVHLSNGGGYLSTDESVRQAVTLALFPTYSILKETTGGMRVPIVAHILNNGIMFSILHAGKYLNDE